MAKVAVIGAGSWGTALAMVLAANGHRVGLWGHDPVHVERIRQSGVNAVYLPGIELPKGIEPEAGLREVVSGADLVLVAVPSHAFADQLHALVPCLDAAGGGSTALLWATKGLDLQANDLLDEVAARILGKRAQLAVMSGPSFAGEVARGLPTAVSVAAIDQGFAESVAAFFHTPTFRVYTTDDVTGVQVGGAVKNVLAIAAGVVDGLGFGANAQAALVTRGLAELTRLGVALGGRRETFAGLAGIGDLMLTCTDNQSRNRRFGLALAAGNGLDEAKTAIGQVVEGVGACKAVRGLAGRYSVEMPICEHVYLLLFEGLTPSEAVTSLLSREPRSEQD